MVKKQLQYPSKAIVPPTIGQTWESTPSVDKFMGYQSPVPQANWQKAAAYSVAATAPSFFMTITPSDTIGVYSQETVIITYQQAFQYQMMAIGKPPVELISVDKWFAPPNQPRFDIPKNQHLYPSFIVDPVQFTRPERSTPDKWLPQKPDIVFDLKKQQYLFPAVSFVELVPVEVITPDKWLGLYPDKIFDLRRQQSTYPTFFIDTTAIPVQRTYISEYDYLQATPVWDLKRQQFTYPSYFAELNKINIHTADQWLGYHPERIDDIKRLQYLNPSEFRVDILLPSEEPVKAESTYPDKVYDLVRNQYLYPTFIIDEKQLTQPERVQVDKWAGNKPDIIFDLKRLQYSYPPFLFDPIVVVSPVLVSSWHPILERPRWDILRQQYTYPYFFVDTKQLTQQEATTIDRFAGQHPDFVLDIKRNQFIYPTFFPSPVFAIVAVPQPATFPIVFTRRTQYQSLFWNPFTPTETITPDKWEGYHPDKIYDLVREQYLYPSKPTIEPEANPLQDFGLQFNGSSSFVTIPDNPAFDFTDQSMSVEAMVVTPVNVTQQSNAEIIKKNLQYIIRLGSGGNIGHLNAVIWTANNTALSINDPVVLTPGQIHHVAISYDGTTFRLFKDGVQVAQAGATGNLVSGTNPITIGSGAGNEFFNGQIDNVKISGATNYTGNFTPPKSLTIDSNTVAAFGFNEGTGTITADLAGSSAIGTLSGSTLPVWVDGLYRYQEWAEDTSPDRYVGYHPEKIYDITRQQYTYPSEFRTEILEPVSEPINSESYHPDKIYDIARLQYLYPATHTLIPQAYNNCFGLQFDGAQNYVQNTSVPKANDEFSVSVWLNQATYVSGQRIGSLNSSFELDLEGVGGAANYKLRLFDSVGANVFVSIPFANGNPLNNAGTWTNLVWTASASNNVVKGYINGNLVFTTAYPNASPIVSGTTTLQFGRYGSGGFFNGKGSQFVVWNQALTNAEVAGIYTGTLPEQTNQRVAWLTIEGSGTTLKDNSGNGLTGTFTGSPVPKWTSGFCNPFVENPQIDKWIGQKPDYIFDLKRQQFTYPYAAAFDPFLLASEEVVTIDKWIGSKPDRIDDLKRQQFTYPAEFRTDLLIPSEEPIKSESQYPDKIYDTTRLQYLYPTNFWNTSTVGERITPDKWLPQQPDKIFDLTREQVLYPFVAHTLLTRFENITPDKYLGYHPDYIFDLKHTQYLYPTFVIDTKQLTQKEIITIDKFVGQKPDIIFDLKRQQYTYPAQAPIDTKQLTVKEQVTIDRYAGYHPDFVLDVKRQQYLYPNLFRTDRDETLPAPWTNYGYHPDRIDTVKRQQYTYPSEFRVDILLPSEEPIKAESQYPDKIYDVARLQYLNPSEFRVDILLPSEEPINAESYHPDKVYDITRQQFTYPFEFRTEILTPVSEAINSESYHPDKIYDVARLQYMYPATHTFVPPAQNNCFALLFDGVQNGVTFPIAQAPTPTTSLTFAVWVSNQKDAINSAGAQSFFEYGYLRLYFRQGSAIGKSAARIRFDESVAHEANGVSKQLNSGDESWHYYVGSYNYTGGTNNTLKFYVDGVLTQITNSTVLPTSNYTGATGQVGKFGASFFQGAIDNLKVFPGVPTDAQVTTMYQEFGGDFTTPLLSFPFNEGQGTTVTDNSGNGQTGTLTGNPLPTWVQGPCNLWAESVSIDRFVGQHPDKVYDLTRQQYTYPVTAAFDFTEIPAQEPWASFSYHPDRIDDVKRLQYLYPHQPDIVLPAQNNCFGLQFDGAQNYVSLPKSANVTNNFTILAVIKPTLPQNTGFIFYNGDDAGGWGLGAGATVDGSGSKLIGLYGGVVWIDPNITLQNNVVQYVAMVRRSGTLFFYLNGVETNSGIASNPHAPTAGVSTIGKEINTLGHPRAYKGVTDTVQVFTRALSATEIANWSNGQAVDATNIFSEWFFNEGAGTTTADNSGNGNTGTLTGNPVPQWVQGFCGTEWLETVSVDRFIGQHPDFVLDIKRQQFLYPAFWRLDNFAPPIPTANEQAVYPSIIFDLKRLQYDYPAFFSPRVLFYFLLYPPPSGGTSNITIPSPSGATTDRLLASGGGASTDQLNAAGNGSSNDALQAATNGDTSDDLLPPPTGGSAV